MNRSTPLKLNTQVSEEAAEWFINFRCGDVDSEGRQAFETWVRSSPEHLRAYLEHAALWIEGDLVDRERRIDVETLIARARAEHNVIGLRQTAREQLRQGVKWKGPWKSLRAAAIFLIFAGASTVVYFNLSPRSVYSTAVGEQRAISLADGSTVELNSRSRLLVRYTERARSVELLEGQALFEVTSEPARPFLVTSGALTVRAIGTQFDVYKKKSGTIVTVIEGKVAVMDGARRSDAARNDRLAAKSPQPGPTPVYMSAGE